MFLELMKEHWQVIVGAASVVAFVITQREIFLKLLKNLWGLIYSYLKVPFILKDFIILTQKQNKELMERLNKLTYETSANGGKSLKDFVVNIFDNVLKNRDMSYLVLDQKPTAIFEANNLGEIVWVNTAMSVLLGMDKQHILNKGWLIAIEDSRREEMYKEWNYSIVSGTPFSVIVRIVNQDTNTLIPCRIRTSQIKSGTNVWYYGNITPLN